MTMTTNGRPQRKSLAGQLDRLDHILDGFADGLNEAVAAAVKDAAVVAVEAAVRELLASAELQKRLNCEPVSRPSLLRTAAKLLSSGLSRAATAFWGWVTQVAELGRNKASEAMSQLQQGRQVLVSRARRGMTAFARRVWLGGIMAVMLARRFRRPILIALASGTVIGVGCYLAGPMVASTVSGLAAFAGSLTGSMLGRVRRILRRAAMHEWYVSRLS
jgi:hypothetical protein